MLNLYLNKKGTQLCQPKLNSQWIGVCQHMQHWTAILNDYLPQWNKPIRILSSWDDNVYGYDF